MYFLKFKTYVSTSSNLKESIKRAVPTLFVRISGMFLTLFVSIFLGKKIGAEGLGVINLANRIVAILLVVCMFGMRQILIKEIAIGYNTNSLKRIGDVIKTSYWFNFGFSIVISTGLIFLSPWLANDIFELPQLKWVLILTFMVFPFQILSRIFSSGLNAYGKIWQSSLVDQTLSVFIAGILMLFYVMLDIEVNIINVIIAYLVGRLFTSLTLGIYWNRLFSSKLKKEQRIKELFASAFPVFLVSITASIYKNIDIVLIGWFCSVKDVGIYAVASRIAILSGFLLGVTNATVAPKFASLYQSNSKEDLRKLVHFTTLTLLVFSILVLLFCILFGSSILSIWGDEFRKGYFVLVILSIGQFFNVSTGLVGTLLTMTGFEKKLLAVNTFFMILNIILNIILISIFGIIGAAIAYALAIFGMNLTRAFLVYKFLNINIFEWKKMIVNS